MTRKKLAFVLGFVATGLLTIDYVFISYVIRTGATPSFVDAELLAAAILLLLPAIVATCGLFIGRKHPYEAGIIEMVLGSLGVVIGLSLVLATLDFLWDGFFYQESLFFSFFSILVSGTLLVASGSLFASLARKQKVITQ